MKKVLIWHNFDLLERAGGPSTYLFQLRRVLNPEVADFFQFGSGNQENTSSEPAKSSGWKKLIPIKLKHFVRINQNLKTELNELNQQIQHVSIDLNHYKAIHFHRTMDVYQALPVLKNYTGKVILTSHTPTAPWLEKMGSTISDSWIKSSIKRAFQEIDNKALERADIVLFPCEEAMEPYHQDWEYFAELIRDKEMEYIPTGTSAVQIKKTRQEVRADLGVPEDAFVVNYFGRHNTIKGYDYLKEIGAEVLKRNKNIYFLIAGKETPLTGLKHPRWIEIGWTTDPFSYLNASDLFVLPNKQTYFDLVLLEVLSVGTRCLITDTGGNKYFSRYKSPGIDYFSYANVTEAIQKIENIASEGNFDKTQLKGLFTTHFTVERFGENYEVFYNSLPE